MKTLDIVFNIDYPSKGSVGPLHTSLPKYVEYLTVNDFVQFKRLINSLKEDVSCHIWVHPSLNSDLVGEGMKSDVEINSVPELAALKIEFNKITRSSQKSNNKDIYDASQMLEFKKSMKSYTVRELHAIIFPTPPAVQKADIRSRLKTSLASDVEAANSRLLNIRKYLVTTFSDKDNSFWFSDLIPSMEDELEIAFRSRYWKFPYSILRRYLNLSNLTTGLIDSAITTVPDTIRFDDDKMQWQIDLSFFNEVSVRFESMNSQNYPKKLMIASCLYVIHEAVHKTHNLDVDTVQGIGNFPRIIEEADYQADAIAMLVELGYFIFDNGGIDKVTPTEIAQKLCDTIQIAIETTFSFNPIDEPLKKIQVRRVNRYLIWFWQYFRIQSLKKTEKTAKELLNSILQSFSVKPNIEITGPAILSNVNRDRTLYDLEDIKHREHLGIMLENNQIIRLGPTASIDFQKFYISMKNSDFDSMLEFLRNILGNYKALLDIQL